MLFIGLYIKQSLFKRIDIYILSFNVRRLNFIIKTAEYNNVIVKDAISIVKKKKQQLN